MFLIHLKVTQENYLGGNGQDLGGGGYDLLNRPGVFMALSKVERGTSQKKCGPSLSYPLEGPTCSKPVQRRENHYNRGFLK